MKRSNVYKILGLFCLLAWSCKEKSTSYTLKDPEAVLLRTEDLLLPDSAWRRDRDSIPGAGYKQVQQSYPVPIMFYINEGDLLYDSITLDN